MDIECYANRKLICVSDKCDHNGGKRGKTIFFIALLSARLSGLLVKLISRTEVRWYI